MSATSTAWALTKDLPEFHTRNGDIYHFVDIQKSWLIAWTHPSRSYGDMEMSVGGTHVTKVEQTTLEFLKVWDGLSPELKKRVQAADALAKLQLPSGKRTYTVLSQASQGSQGSQGSQVHRGRRPRYDADIPRKLVCGCGFETTIGPGLLLQKAAEAGVTWEEYVKTYQCRRCTPKVPKALRADKPVSSGKKGHRGRQPDPRYVGLPRKISCSQCGKEAGMGPGLLLSTAEADGLTWEEWLKTYLCRKCKGSASSSISSSTGIRRGRKPNPAYAGIPKKLVCCKCKEEKGTTPEQYLKQVEKSGKSRKMFEKHYKCRSCRK